jgi:hypothetical protein
MAVVFLFPVGNAAAQFFNNSGVILSGGTLTLTQAPPFTSLIEILYT